MGSGNSILVYAVCKIKWKKGSLRVRFEQRLRGNRRCSHVKTEGRALHADRRARAKSR